MVPQSIVDGFQHEQPDYWLNFGNPWEIERLNVAYPIKYYGHVSVTDEDGRQSFNWNPGETVRPIILLLHIQGERRHAGRGHACKRCQILLMACRCSSAQSAVHLVCIL